MQIYFNELRHTDDNQWMEKSDYNNYPYMSKVKPNANEINTLLKQEKKVH